MKILQFGNALFERSAPFHEQPVSTERLERLKSFRGNPGRLAEVMAKRMEKDLYEPSGRMPKNAQALPHIIESAEQERELRAEHLDRVRRNSAKPNVISKAKINLELARLKLANARLAQGSSSQSENKAAINALRATLRRLDALGYGAGKRLAPAYVHAKANSGAFTLNHDVHHYTKIDNGADMPYQEKVFEGMAVSPPPNRLTETEIIQKMEAELPELQQAIDTTSRMKTSKASDAAFAKASFRNLKAEGHHALSHYYGRNQNFEEFQKQSQNARKAVKLADEALQSIPATDMTREHSRLAYNLNTKTAHLCDKHQLHAPRSNRAKELCATIVAEDFPQNIQLIQHFPEFDPSGFGLPYGGYPKSVFRRDF